MEEKIVISLVSVVAGVLISQFFERLREKKRIRRLKGALITELSDIRERLESTCSIYERLIQIGALGGVSNEIPLAVGNYIFEKHYAEIATHMRASQRKSYEIIHGYINSINSGIVKLVKLHEEITENLTKENFEKWNSYLSAHYQTAAIAYWHVSYHLKNPDFPFLDNEDSPEYRSMLDTVKESKAHVKNLAEGARKNLTREMFE